MPTLTITTKKEALTSPLSSLGSMITVQDTGLSGGFGSIYKTTLNSQEFAVKILHSQSANNNHKTINALIDKIDLEVNTIYALKAMPLLSFEGAMGNKQVKGYITHFLNQNYLPLDDIIISKGLSYSKLSFDKRFLLVRKLYQALDKLESFSFIHADINGSNIMIDLQNLDLVIIDFDSGAITNGNNNIPSTFGKMNEYLAPEIKEQIIQKSKKINVNIHSERFAGIVAIHYLLFMQPPYCFVNKMSKQVMTNYIKKYGWSNTPKSSESYFTREILPYSKMVTYVKSNNKELFRALEVSLNKGYFNKESRVSYKQFLFKLDNTKKHPKKILKPKNIKRVKMNFKYLLYIIGLFIITTSFFYFYQKVKYSAFVQKKEPIIKQTSQNEDRVKTIEVEKFEKLDLHKNYISKHYILLFSDIWSSNNKINFSYKIIKQDFSTQTKGEGYIINKKIYFNHYNTQGQITITESNDIKKISFINDIFI